MSSAIYFNLDQSKILSYGNGLINSYTAPNDKTLDWTKLKTFTNDKFRLLNSLPNNKITDWSISHHLQMI